MPSTELTAIITRVFQRWPNPGDEDNTCILNCRLVAGECPIPPDEDGITWFSIKIREDPDRPFTEQLNYRWWGYWGKYRGEPQFQGSSYATAIQLGRGGVVRYLAKHGSGCGIGPAKAGKIYDKWGDESLEICRKHPQLVAQEVRITLKKAEAFAGTLWMEKKFETVEVEVMEILAGHGFPTSAVRDMMREWGLATPHRIRKSPFAMLRFAGCGFKRCDHLYLALGKNELALKRQALCVAYELDRDSSGNTWLPFPVAERVLTENIGGKANLVKAIELGLRAPFGDGPKLLETVSTDIHGRLGGSYLRWVSSGTKALQEKTLAHLLARSTTAENRWSFIASAADELQGYSPTNHSPSNATGAANTASSGSATAATG